MQIYAGNLNYDLTESALAEIFAAYGEVAGAKIIMDRDTGRSKGFGFVEMNNDEEAMNAIQALNGQEIDGRAIRVNEARPKASGGRRDQW